MTSKVLRTILPSSARDRYDGATEAAATTTANLAKMWRCFMQISYTRPGFPELLLVAVMILAPSAVPGADRVATEKGCIEIASPKTLPPAPILCERIALGVPDD
jgi:hypothetical protein